MLPVLSFKEILVTSKFYQTILCDSNYYKFKNVVEARRTWSVSTYGHL